MNKVQARVYTGSFNVVDIITTTESNSNGKHKLTFFGQRYILNLHETEKKKKKKKKKRLINWTMINRPTSISISLFSMHEYPMKLQNSDALRWKIYAVQYLAPRLQKSVHVSMRRCDSLRTFLLSLYLRQKRCLHGRISMLKLTNNYNHSYTTACTSHIYIASLLLFRVCAGACRK